MSDGFRVLGAITGRLFPTGKETPKNIGRDFKQEPKSGTKIEGWSMGGKPGRKKS